MCRPILGVSLHMTVHWVTSKFCQVDGIGHLGKAVNHLLQVILLISRRNSLDLSLRSCPFDSHHHGKITARKGEQYASWYSTWDRFPLITGKYFLKKKKETETPQNFDFGICFMKQNGETIHVRSSFFHFLLRVFCCSNKGKQFSIDVQ